MIKVKLENGETMKLSEADARKLADAVEKAEGNKGSSLDLSEMTDLIGEILPMFVTLAIVRAISGMLSSAFH